MCPSMVSPMHTSIIHGAGEQLLFSFCILPKAFQGCILVFEYSYFLLLQNEHARNAIDLAVKQYTNSGTQAVVLDALQHAIEQSGDDHHALTHLITEIILHNCMCKLIFFKTT